MTREILACLMALLGNAALADQGKWDEYIKGASGARLEAGAVPYTQLTLQTNDSV